MKPYRADNVGSMLRPDYLLEARQNFKDGQITHLEFRKTEDKAVDECVKVQVNSGLDVISDGEMRRAVFADQIVQATDGFDRIDNNTVNWFTMDGEKTVDPVTVGLTATMKRRRFPSVEEFCYLRAKTDKPIKMTIPSPTMYAYYWVPGVSDKIFSDNIEYINQVGKLLNEEVTELVRQGVEYIQFDAPEFGMLIDPIQQEWFKGKGFESEDTIRLGNQIMNHIIDTHPKVTFGLHVCKGNDKNRYMAYGGYDSVAELIFGETKAHRLLLEYDDERSGDFKPLQYVPEDKFVVLGLISTKVSKMETVKKVKQRVIEATEYISLEKLALSTQCGFASVAEGNHLSIERQEEKLSLVSNIAREVWVD
ncbi:MAG: cobalamin-independent methionine synthase II family protein [Candidatus Kariarchaeaceae archaeon]|jgi:5-methyltetrahydropteroyltriglutamate--homocysteine methyltransferase